MNIPRIPNVSRLMNVGKNFVKANRPEILFGASVTSTIGAVILAARGGYNARGVVEDHKKNLAVLTKADPEDISISPKDQALLTWQCYIPAAGATAISLGSITGLHLVHIKEKKALAQAALAAADETKKVVEQIGKEHAGVLTQDETDKVLTERADEEGKVQVKNFDGEIEELYLVRDARTGRDKWSNKRIIEDALNETNSILSQQGDISLNSFYNYADFDWLPDGDDLGWSGELVKIKWETPVTREDGFPVVPFSFLTPPTSGMGSAY